jgi:hypothetical protein
MQPEKREARNRANDPSLNNKEDQHILNSTQPEPFASPYGFALEQFDWGHPTEAETSWLVRQGISLEALLKPWPIGATNVDVSRGAFVPMENGERVLTFVCFDRGFPIDVVAWQPRTGKLALYSGLAFCLGDVDDIFNPATSFDGHCLHIHATPLEWLQSGRDGIVIVKPKLARAYLGHLPSVFCPKPDHARKVRRWVRVPQHNPKIFTATAKEVA